MSQQNVDAIRRVYERWSEGDLKSAIEVFDPLVLFVMPPDFPDTGTYLGVERIAEYTRGFLEPWTRITLEADEIADAGDHVVASVCQRGVGGVSGAATEFRYTQVWSFRGGRVIRLENFRERADALEAAGLSR